MIFNSFEFVIFAIIVVAWLLLLTKFSKNVTVRNISLLLASYFFYGWFNFGFLTILLYVTGVNYVGALFLNRYENRKAIVSVIVLLSLLPLILYKYSAFLMEDVLNLDNTNLNGLIRNLILPVGISFYTFQALTYTIDIYRRKVVARRNIVDVALFVSFFPTILSGPIEKARNLLPQIEKLNPITPDDIRQAITIFIWGVFKKVVIADRLASYVDWAYGGVEYMSGGTLLLAAIFYSIQIYCDFSGYSDMAIGISKGMGFNLSQNFRYPYFATSIKDFWRRWHISLTSWFTEYVYFSLGGNRVRLKSRWVFNIAMVFILSGIWHGAAWTFLIWGGLHAVLYLCEHFLGLQEIGKKNYAFRFIAGIIVFGFVTLAWIFFRADNLGMATSVIERIFTQWGPVDVGSSTFQFIVNIFLLMIFVVFEWKFYRDSASVQDTSIVTPPRGALWMASAVLLLGFFSVSSDKFVYFQF